MSTFLGRAPWREWPLLLVVPALVLCLLFANRVLAKNVDDRPVVLVSSFSFPPLLHATETGEFSGTMGETVKMLCENGDLNCHFDVVSLKRAYHEIRAGNTDALITINVGQLKDCCIPSDWSSPWSAGFFSSQGPALIPKTQEDLVGQTLIVVNGMKSPYLFAKDLDQMNANKRLVLHKAPHILSSVRMFLKNRAPLLWGGEDFKWYLNKIGANVPYDFKPKVELPVVVWVRKDKPELLKRLNQAFKNLDRSRVFGAKNLLAPALMQKRYVDAPLPE